MPRRLVTWLPDARPDIERRLTIVHQLARSPSVTSPVEATIPSIRLEFLETAD
jgi:hypothetical protein